MPKIVAVVRYDSSSYDVDMQVGRTLYSFHISSERTLERATKLCQKGAPYRALNLLKKEHTGHLQ
jgi:hypothetical protein